MVGPLILAAVLWVIIFVWQPLNFWVLMATGVGLLAAVAWRARPGLLQGPPSLNDVIVGLLLAALLYGVFWVGDRVATALFPFAPRDVGRIYDLREWASPTVIAVLLLFVIGPGEELFWRGLIQARWMQRAGGIGGWLATSAVYALVHVVTLNPMLILAALTAGLAWGYAYLRLRRLWPLIISHAVWDVAILVLWPIR